jgi:hypothetical protein
MNEEANNPNPQIVDAAAPDDTITVTPTSLWFLYYQRHGQEVLGVMCEDPRLGHIAIALDPEDAAELARGLARVSGPQLSQLRAAYAARKEQAQP